VTTEGPGAPPPERAGYVVRRVGALGARKDYTCPGCGNRIPARTGHVVAWPEEMPDDRAHWHAHCWRIAASRS
jgi:hypothetical protein